MARDCAGARPGYGFVHRNAGYYRFIRQRHAVYNSDHREGDDDDNSSGDDNVINDSTTARNTHQSHDDVVRQQEPLPSDCCWGSRRMTVCSVSGKLFRNGKNPVIEWCFTFNSTPTL